MILSQPETVREGVAVRWVFKAEPAIGFPLKQQALSHLYQQFPSRLAGFGHFEEMNPFGAHIVLQSGGGVMMFVHEKDGSTLFSFTPLQIGTWHLTSQATMEDALAVAQLAYQLLSVVDL